jgi:hypothetical protein
MRNSAKHSLPLWTFAMSPTCLPIRILTESLFVSKILGQEDEFESPQEEIASDGSIKDEDGEEIIF